jgi:hypothetical protein
MFVQVAGRRDAQRTVRATVSSAGRDIRSDSPMVERNPAPDSSPAPAAGGSSHWAIISSGTRY